MKKEWREVYNKHVMNYFTDVDPDEIINLSPSQIVFLSDQIDLAESENREANFDELLSLHKKEYEIESEKVKSTNTLIAYISIPLITVAGSVTLIITNNPNNLMKIIDVAVLSGFIYYFTALYFMVFHQRQSTLTILLIRAFRKLGLM